MIGILMWRGARQDRAAASEPYVKQGVVLGTSVKIKTYGPDRKKLKEAVDDAFAAMERIEKITDRRDPDSEVSRVHRARMLPRIEPASEELKYLVRLSNRWRRLTGGYFNVGIAQVMDLWGFGEKERIPSDAEISDALKTLRAGAEPTIIPAQYGRLGPSGEGIYTPNIEFQIDLGGVAKGYATDVAAKTLRRHGIRSALIDTGSSALTLGTKPDGAPWRLGLQRPRQKAGEVMGIVKLKGGVAISTSGDYQQYFVRNGKRYHHILNPFTGRPAEGVVSATVITSRPGAEADILSTALMAMGYEKATQFLSSHPEYKAVITTSDGRVHRIGGLEGMVENLAETVTIHD